MTDNKKLFELSVKLKEDNDKKQKVQTPEERKVEDLLIFVLTEKFEKLADGDNKDLLKATFEKGKNVDPAFKLIDGLVRVGAFESLTRPYKIYLGGSNKENGEVVSYDVLWDYRSYNESMVKSKIETDIREQEDSRLYHNAFETFVTLPQGYQKNVLDGFRAEVRKAKISADAIESRRVCANEGHKFSNWKEESWVTETTSYATGVGTAVTIPHHQWRRVCERCGYAQTSSKEPKELAEARKRKEMEWLMKFVNDVDGYSTEPKRHV